MKDSCLDIGVIQAFLDGELVHTESARVSGHVAICDTCALMLAEAEDESAVVFPALEREFNSLVPTQRLWNKISDSIAIEKQRMPFWQKAWGFVVLNFANPSFAAAASLLIIVGVVASVWIGRPSAPVDVPDGGRALVSQSKKPSLVAPDTDAADTKSTDPVYPQSAPSDTHFERADFRPVERRTNVRTNSDVRRPVSPLTSTGYLPGEESYVKTISSLSRSIDPSKDRVMRPAERIAYERDMAVVDDAIAKMRSEVKKNPRNDSARQVLYTSYQNKIDLLNSVSQKEELVASLR